MPAARIGASAAAARGAAAVVAAVVVLAALLLAVSGASPLVKPAVAATAPAENATSGVLELRLSGKAAKRLRKRGLKLRGGRGAKVRGKRISLPIASGEATSIARMELRGTLRIVSKPKQARRAKRGKRGKSRGKRARKRSVLLRRFGSVLVAGDGHLVTTIKGQQVTLLTFSQVGDQPFNPLSGEIEMRRAGVKLTPMALSAISAALRGAKLPRRLGRTSIVGQVPVTPAENTNATVRERPAGAVDLLGASMTWRARESFVNYIHSARGGGGGAFAIAPAVPGAPELIPPSTQARVYEFKLPFAGGWYDPASGTVNAELAGGIRFSKPDFGIDLDAIEPVIELGGEAPRVIAQLRGRAATSDQDGRTAIAVDLDQAAVTPQVEPGPGGTEVTYEDIPARNPAGPTAWIFATYYPLGADWGEVSVSYTIPNG